MDNKQNEDKVSVKENLKSLDRETKKTLFNVVVVSACGLFFVALVLYLALTQPSLAAKLMQPTIIGPIMPTIVQADFVEKISTEPKLVHPVYRGEKVEYVHPVYRGEPVEITFLSDK